MDVISKIKLERLIKDGSGKVSIDKSKTIRPEIAGIVYNGKLLQDFGYCKMCHKVLTLSKGSTGNIVRHCKSHVQCGSGISEQDQAVNYHYPKTTYSKPHISIDSDTSDQIAAVKYHYPETNIPKPHIVNIPDKMAKSNYYELPKHITSDTLRYLKESNMLGPQPDLAISKVIMVEIQDGIQMAHVQWSDPTMYSTWIPARNLLKYYIYDTEIQYDAEDDSAETQSGNGLYKSRKSKLSILQKRALRHRKRMHHNHHSQ